MTHPPWDDSYTGPHPAPWDIGRPQPEFVRLAEAGLLTGHVLDVGCGTGEHTLLAAEHGADALGVDIAPAAIEQARAKAAARHSAARFEVADALHLDTVVLDTDALAADTLIDSGVFHVFRNEDRPRYVDSIAAVLRPGGVLHLMCFSDRQPGDFGPRRVRQDELRAAFADGWTISSIDAAEFEVLRIEGHTTAQAWLAAIVRG